MPAVSTRVGSVGEVVLDGTTGLLCTVDVDALVAAVDRMLSDTTMRQGCGEAAKQHAQAQFSRARLVADTERLYEQIAVEKGLLCASS